MDANKQRTRRLYAILAAEPSGDLQAAALIPHLRELDPNAEFFGIGGRRLREEGVELLCDTSCWGSIGPSEVFGRLPEIAVAYVKLRRTLLKRRPDVVVMLDSPALFMRLAKFTKKHGLRSIYYFPPSAWSESPRRMREISERVSGIVCTFRRNYDTYVEAGIPVVYHGHPMVDVVRPRSRREALSNLGFPAESKQRFVVLLPGSRLQEVRLMTPIYLQTAKLLKQQDPDLQFLLPAASSQVYEKIQKMIDDESVHLINGKAQDAMAVSEFAVMTSGSVSLEAAYLDCPMVLAYRFNWFDAALAKFLVFIGLLKLKHIALPSLVLDETIIPEIIQDEVTPQRLVRESLPFLSESPQRNKMLSDLARVREALGASPVVSKIASYIADFAKRGEC